MSDIRRMNRFLQFAYPIIILFSVLLAWSSSGQMTSFYNLRSSEFDPNHSERGLGEIQISCEEPRLNFRGPRSCGIESSPLNSQFQ